VPTAGGRFEEKGRGEAEDTDPRTVATEDPGGTFGGLERTRVTTTISAPSTRSANRMETRLGDTVEYFSFYFPDAALPRPETIALAQSDGKEPDSDESGLVDRRGSSPASRPPAANLSRRHFNEISKSGASVVWPLAPRTPGYLCCENRHAAEGRTDQV
jgi:hypothetical protein